MLASCVNSEEPTEVVYLRDMGGGSDLSKAAARLGIPLWGRLLIVALVMLVSSATTGFVIGFIRLGKIESAVRALTLKAGQDVRDLVHDLLASAAKDEQSGNSSKAEKTLTIIPVLLRRAKNDGVPAPPAYFTSSIDALNSLQSKTSSAQLVQDVRRSRIEFAEYRSKLSPSILPDPKATYVLIPERPPFNLSQGPGSFQFDVSYGLVIDLKNVPPGQSILAPGDPPFFSGVKTDNPDRPIFMMNGTQPLDNMDWINVVFSHMHIRYSGGHVTLQNVRFVDCTFDFAQSAQSDQLANYVALELPAITIKG
jgi:hypothetical protein